MPPPINPQAVLAVLVELMEIRRAVARLEYQTVNLLRLSGLSWETIGEAMDPPISRQAAARKYGQPRQRLI